MPPAAALLVWARRAAQALTLAAAAVSRSGIWKNAIVQAAVLPLVAVQCKRWADALLQAATDRVFSRVRFRQDAELRSFISHKLQNTRAGYAISTLDEEHGAAEVLRDMNNVDLYAYSLRAHGAAPLHVTHLPLEASSSWLWLAGAPGAPWWSLPIVWICPESVESPFWSSLPAFIKSMVESATATIRRFMSVPEDDGAVQKSNCLVVSTFRWHTALVDRVANDAARFGEQSRTRSCPIQHLRSDGIRQIVAPPRRMSTVILAKEGEALLADIASFFGRREWYRANDLPYQRVYLLHGPPGNGKSSFLQALAIMFSMPFM